MAYSDERTMIFAENALTETSSSQPSKEVDTSTDNKTDVFVDAVSAISLTPEMFKEVRATLANHVGKVLQGKFEMLLNSHALKLSLMEEKHDSEVYFSVIGTLHDILSAHVLFQSAYTESCKQIDDVNASPHQNSPLSPDLYQSESEDIVTMYRNVNIQTINLELENWLPSTVAEDFEEISTSNVYSHTCINNNIEHVDVGVNTENELSYRSVQESWPQLSLSTCIENMSSAVALNDALQQSPAAISEEVLATSEIVQESCDTPGNALNDLQTVSCQNSDASLRRSSRIRTRKVYSELQDDDLNEIERENNKCSKFTAKTTNRKNDSSTAMLSDTDQENNAVFDKSENSNANQASNASDKSSTKQRSGMNWRHYDERMPFKYFCELCSFKTKRSSHLNKHKLLHNKVDTLLRCTQCPFTTLHQSHLRRHAVLHSNTVHHCDQCPYKSDDQKLLFRHVRTKHGNTEQSQPIDGRTHKVYECSECTFHTTRLQFYVRHVRIHRKKPEPRKVLYQCEQCDYKTSRKVHFVRHSNNVHSEKRPYLCHKCGKAFKRTDALRQHSIIHEDGSGVPCACPDCHKVFKSRAHMYQHRAVHTNVRMFLCEVCGASFKTRAVQRKHIQSIHKNPRSHPCPCCKRSFNTHFALRRHIKTHKSATQSDRRESISDANNIAVASSEENAISVNDAGNILLTVEANQSITQTVSMLSTTPVVTTFSSKHLPLGAEISAVSVAQNCISATDLVQQYPTTVLYLTNNVPS